jgi:hypothetical protein
MTASEFTPQVIPFRVDDTKRELAIRFRQEKEGCREPQPLDDEPDSVTLRLYVDGVWNEYAMSWDDADSRWIYRFSTEEFAAFAVPSRSSRTFEMNCFLEWLDGSATSPTEGTDFLKVGARS